MKFKVGDRVNVYCSYMSNYGLSGEIDSISIVNNEAIKVIFDDKKFDSNWYLVKQCRKLVKKPIKFEVGDRCVIEIEGEKKKCTILHNHYPECKEYYVKFDKGFHGFFPINYRKSKCKYVRKLVKKRKFNIGDVVKFKLDDHYINGEIYDFLINNVVKIFTYVSEDSFISRSYRVPINQIELVKKKTEFKVGDRVIFKQSNCNCEELRYLDGRKGIIKVIKNSDFDSTVALVDNIGLISVKHLKKLVKKKKVDKKSNIRDKVKELHELAEKLFKENKEQKLLPCPFCGCEDVLFSVINNKVNCCGCGNQVTLSYDIKLMTEYWNRRSYPLTSGTAGDIHNGRR